MFRQFDSVAFCMSKRLGAAFTAPCTSIDMLKFSG
jgi:hypothetical protein